MKTLTSSLFMSLSMLAVGCGGGSGNDLGSIQGRIVNQSGEPVRSARVVLNDATGLSAMTDEDGNFQLSDVDAGRQVVHAIDFVGFAAGSAEIDVASDQSTPVGDLMVRGCNENGDGNNRPEPCSWEWPAPASRQVRLDTVALEYTDAAIYSNSLSLSGHDIEGSILYLTIHAPGSFMTGGSATLQLEPADGFSGADIMLHYMDENGVHHYQADGGSFTVEVTGSDVDTKSVSVRGTDLTFSRFDWNTVSQDPSYKATIGSLSIDTTASVILPPAPPTENISLGTTLQPDAVFLHSDEYVSFLHIYDNAKGFSAYIDFPTSALSLPGTSTISKDNQIGYSRVEMATGRPVSWVFPLEQLSITTTATAIEPCKPVSLTLENASFRYEGWEYDANGNQVPVPSDIMLTFDRLDVTVTPEDGSGCSFQP